MSSGNIIQYENQLFRQVLEQPDYIKGNAMEKHQIAGFLKYTPSQTQFGPAFFNFCENVSKAISDVLPNIQNVGFAYESGEVVSSLIQQVRTTKPLPVTLKCPAALGHGPGRPKTCYDQDFILITETPEEAEETLERVKTALNIPGLYWNETFYGKALQAKEIVFRPFETERVTQKPAEQPLELVHTPGAHTMDDLANFFQMPKNSMVKLVCYTFKGQLVIVHIRGDLGVDIKKLAHALGLSPFDGPTLLQMAPAELLARHGIVSGYGSACGAKDLHAAIVIFDESIREMHDTIVGGNKEDHHFVHYDYARDSAKQLKYITFADIAESMESSENELETPKDQTVQAHSQDILVEAVKFNTKIPLLGAQNKKVQAIMTRIRIRYYELLLAVPNSQSYAIYCMQQIPAKFEDQRQKSDEILNKINKKYYIIVDDRPKVTGSQKQQLTTAGFFSHILIFNKNTTDEEVDGLVYNDEEKEYVEGKIKLADLQ